MTQDRNQSNKQRGHALVTKIPRAPHFFYRDYSDLEDPDPSKPVTPQGRIPNFPAKMMAILSRPDLAHIISWMPHGRAWKVHKSREFETQVIPAYFEHSKFSSFVRQANGWGFRRMVAKGPDRNAYYHEMFLRGTSHLIKLMKRPTVTIRPPSDATTEPNFYKIAEERPLPEAEREGEKFQEFHTSAMERKYRNFVPSWDDRSSASSSNRKRSKKTVEITPKPHRRVVKVVPSSHHVQQHDHHYSSYPPRVVYDAQRSDYDRSRVETSYQLLPIQSVLPPSARRVSPPHPVSVCSDNATNEWTKEGVEPLELPFDFEDPFAGGLSPVDFW